MNPHLSVAFHAKALIFAEKAHYGQKRKYTGEPFIDHSKVVAQIMVDYGFDDYVVAAAFLHDVLEDTTVTKDVLIQTFGHTVANLVYELTDVSKPSDGNRAVRKAIDREHLQTASPEAQSIKCADIVDNTLSIAYNDPQFAKTYIPEIKELLAVLTKADTRLLEFAWETVRHAEQHLNRMTSA